MFGNESIPDKAIFKDVNKRLAKTGLGRCRVAATVREGQVTIIGQLQHERQRYPVMLNVRQVDGMRGVAPKATHDSCGIEAWETDGGAVVRCVHVKP